MSKIKVGDKVKRLEYLGSPLWQEFINDYPIDDEFLVTSVDNQGCIGLQNWSNSWSGDQPFNGDNFVIIKEEKQVYKFKVGDRVVKTKYPSLALLTGEEVIVSDTYENGFMVQSANDPKRLLNVVFDYDHFELVDTKLDEMPEVEEGVRYIGDHTAYSIESGELSVDKGTDKVLIHFNGFGISLEPDSVLDLASDLTRMALAIKRKEREEEV